MTYDAGPTSESDAREVEALLVARLESGPIDVPVLPEAAAQIMTETSRDDWKPEVIVECLRRDPTMAAHLLRLSNSVAFRGSSPVVSLQQAVARLGATQLRQLATVIACETRVFKVPGFEAAVHDIFHHSIATAFLARDIARQRRANVEDAFLTGLLHDVGWPLVLQLAVELRVDSHRSVVYRVARRSHAALARRLADQWRLPERIGLALEQHHAEQWAGEAGATLALADALGRFAENDAEGDRVRSHPATAVLNLYPDAVERLLALAPKVHAEAAAS